VRGGLASSVVLHAAILAWALITIQAQRELRMPEQEPIAVDLVSPSELTRLRQGARDAKQLEAQPKESPKAEPSKKEAPKPTPAATAPPPPPPPPPKEEPKEEPKKEVASLPPPAPAPPPPAAPAPDEQEKLNALLKEQERQAEERKKVEEQKKIEEQKRLEEERRQAELKKKLEEDRRRKEAELKKKREDEKKRKDAEAKKKQFDAEKIAALINKAPDKGAPRPQVPLDEQAKSLNKGPVLGAPEGRDQVLSASELAVLKQIIRSCVGPKWNVLGGGEEAQNTIVKIRVLFHPDGRLAAAPQIVNPQNSPFFLASAESALRAVQACEPYPLPPDKYNAWKDTILTLNPRDMF
jgi:colicin import membrane protein